MEIIDWPIRFYLYMFFSKSKKKNNTLIDQMIINVLLSID